MRLKRYNNIYRIYLPIKLIKFFSYDKETKIIYKFEQRTKGLRLIKFKEINNNKKSLKIYKICKAKNYNYTKYYITIPNVLITALDWREKDILEFKLLNNCIVLNKNNRRF